MGRFVIVVYKPKLGKDEQLLGLVARHWRALQAQGLVTERAPYAMKAADGSVVEVFEWRSKQAIEQAHRNPAVLGLWAEFEAVCEYRSLSALAEAQQMFDEFEPLEL